MAVFPCEIPLLLLLVAVVSWARFLFVSWTNWLLLPLLPPAPAPDTADTEKITFLEFSNFDIDTHDYNLAAGLADLWWTIGRITLKCIYIFAVTFSKMEKLVKFLILHKFYKYVHRLCGLLS